MLRTPIDRLSVHEGIARGNRNGIHVMSIDKINVANVRVEDVHVVDECVVNIDDGDKAGAGKEPREERLPKAQREPAHAKASPKTPASAKEAHKRRPVNRRPIERARAPAPAAREIVPAAIMEGSKAPGVVVNPSPTPRVHPAPITVAVRSPTRGHIGGVPHMSVLRLIAPGAVVIEIVIAGHVAGNVPPGNRAIFFQVALFRPAIKSVAPRCATNAVGRILHAVKFR